MKGLSSRARLFLIVSCVAILMQQSKSFHYNSLTGWCRNPLSSSSSSSSSSSYLQRRRRRNNQVYSPETKLQLFSLNLNGENNKNNPKQKTKDKQKQQQQKLPSEDDAADLPTWVQNLGSRWPSTTATTTATSAIEEEEKAVAATATEKAKSKGRKIVASLSKIKQNNKKKKNARDDSNSNDNKHKEKEVKNNDNNEKKKQVGKKIGEINKDISNNKEDSSESTTASNTDFPAWVQTLSRWPSTTTTERNAEQEKAEEQQVDKAKTKTTKTVKATTEVTAAASKTKQSTRAAAASSNTAEVNNNNENNDNNSPFLSPLANLLSLKDILLAQGEDIPTVIMENSEVLNEISGWDSWINTLKQSMKGVTDEAATAVTAVQADLRLNISTSKLETMLSEASVVVSPNYVTSMLDSARGFVQKGQENVKEEAEKVAKSSGLDDLEAAERANETVTYVNNFVMVADTLLRYGYVPKTDASSLTDSAEITTAPSKKKSKSELISLSKQQQQQQKKTSAEEEKKTLANENESSSQSAMKTSPLFSSIKSAKEISRSEYGSAVRKGAEMGQLSASIYELDATAGRPRCFDLGHSIVAVGTSANVRWMVTDSIANDTDFGEKKKPQKEPIHVRTITVRGYDASDEEVDREDLLTTICTLAPQTFDSNAGILVHSGILSLATAIYEDIKQYIDWSGPSHRIVFNGHSIGGSISILLMLLLAKERGVGYVRDKVLRVFTFGSPPLFQFENDESIKSWIKKDIYSCDFLNALGLPSNMVYGYNQPWDPIPRLFSEFDALYPLVDDIGDDGLTLFVNGPPRTLRFVVKALLEAWGDGWVKTRRVLTDAGAQKYRSVGIQHLLLAEPIRYLSDRFVSTNVNVPPIDQVIRVSSRDLYPFLTTFFPMTVFELSLVPSAIRGFIHHFYPAYDETLFLYAKKKKEKKGIVKSSNNSTAGVAPQDASSSSSSSTKDAELVSLTASSEGEEKGEGWGLTSNWLYGTVKQFRTE